MSANVSVMRYAPEHKLSPAWPEVEALVARGSGVDKLGIATRVRANRTLVGVVVAFSPLSGRCGAHNAGLAALRDWPESLRRRFGADGVQLGRGSAHSLVVWSPAALLPSVGAWLAAQPAVHWVEPLPRLRQHNREASAIVQAGTAASDGGGLDYTSPTYHPAWAAGLTGSGQVIGAGDSGVDRFHCFFYDPDVDWDDNVSYQDGVQTFSSTQHRKIRYYRAYGDMADYNGHGTHTMGTLLGSMIGGLNYTASGSSSSSAYGSNDPATTAQYVGMAPDAKLAFIDLANGASSSIYTPADIEGQYFAYTTAVGAALHSDSWGGSTVQYDYLAAQVDDYHWQHPEFLAFFAAGNDGQLYGSGNSETTVTSPATAKNIVAVGATQTAGESLGAYASRYTTYDATVTMAGQEYGSFKVMQSAFGGALSALGSDSYKLVAADPALACSAPLNDGGNASGAVVLVERGSCYLSDKVTTAQAAGGAAALIADNVLGGYFVAGADDGASVSIPSATLTRRLGQTLRTALASGLDLRVAFAPAQAPPTSQSFNNLASYSSQGPTPDGRVKPDLVAPGSLYSAKAAAGVGSQTCALTGMQGTSMATPATAGSAALVRQYYVEGRYEGNATADGGGAFTPSGALLKATLISGAASLTGFEALTGMPIDPPPSFRQGFGRVQLETTLPNDGRRASDASASSSSASFALQVVDRVPIAQGATHRYCLRSTGGPLTVTLVWTDYPALPSAAKALVNDLDLTVRAAGYSGIPLLGNGGSIANESVPDRENNVEQVSLAYVPAGAVSIEVAGYYVYPGSGDAQPYALAVNGAFSGALSFPSNGGDDAQECTIVVPEITSGPQGPTNQTPVRFAFGTRGGSSGGLAWECRLTDGDGAIGARGTQNWTACDSPAEFSDLRDGGYVFSVRAAGESTLANRTFFLDTSPPELMFGSDSFPAAGASTDAAIANVSFSATDALSVRFQCALSVADGADAQGETVFLGGINVLEWGLGGALQNCTSPMAFHWLLPGRWTLAVQATDAAGNRAGVSNYTWTVAFDASLPYARLTNGLLGRSRLVSDIMFDFVTLQQTSDGGVAAVADQGAECALVEGYASAASLGDASWAACSRPRSLGNLSEGSYAFFVRPVSVNAVGSTALQGALTDGTGRVAGSAFVLDGTPPVASFSSRPASILAVTNVNVAFDANEAGASFNCSVSGPGFEDQSRACTSPLQLKDLTDGNYTVTVVPSDLVGNIGRPITTSFTVDATPPVFESVSYPPATSGSSLTVDFTVSDGNGTGIAYTICRLVSGDTIAESTGTADASGWRNCSSPVTWTSLTENHWILEIEAFDRAGNANSTGDLDFWVDRTPPVIRVSQGPSSFATVQGTLAFSFAEVFSQGGNRSAAPMAAYQLRLASISQDEYDRLKNGTASTDASGNKLASAGRRLLQAADAGAAQGPGTVSASDALGGWANCSASCEVSGLDSGTYTYQVRGIDLANNVGNETAPVAFAFEASDGGGGGGGGGGLPTWAIGVIAGVGGAALLALFTWCTCALCRNRRRKPPPPAAAPAVGWPAHAGGAPPGAQYYQPNPVYTPRPANVGYPPAPYQPAAAVEEQQLAYALAASEYEARVQAQKREAAARAARQGAVNGGAPNGSLTGGAPNGAQQAQPPMNGQSDEDAQLRAAIEASLREQNLTRQWDPWRG